MTYPPTRFPNAGPGYPGLFPNGSVLWFNQVRAAPPPQIVGLSMFQNDYLPRTQVCWCVQVCMPAWRAHPPFVIPVLMRDHE